MMKDEFDPFFNITLLLSMLFFGYAIHTVFGGGTLSFIFIYIFTIIFVYLFSQKVFLKFNPILKTIAVIGLPKSGKTTLIVSLFGESFAGNLPVRMKPRGTQTIKRVNESLEMLDNKHPIGPTRDQDRFSFRADVTRGGFFSRTYKIEFGDFAGEESQKYLEDYKSGLNDPEFLKWIIGSDGIIFVIDIGKYLVRDDLKKKYIAKMTNDLRSAWQLFLDNNEYRINKVKRQPLILVFTKADLFGIAERSSNWDIIEEKIARLGFNEIPPINQIDNYAYEKGKCKINEDFAELIKYFEREAPNFQVLFTSSFGMLDGRRLGFRELIMAVLPH